MSLMGLLGDYGSGSEDSSDDSDQEVQTKGREIFYLKKEIYCSNDILSPRANFCTR